MTRLQARTLARRAPLACHLALTFAFTWALLPFAADAIPVSLVALCGPAVAAFVVAALGDPDDRRAFMDRLKRWRVPARWYLLALLLPLLISASRSGLESLLGADGPIRLQEISVLGLVIFVLVAGEEIGWRGFVLPHLRRRFCAWSASAVIGIIWALWHLPLFYMPGMPQYGSPFAAFIVYTMALSLILTALAERTAYSVVIATLFHGAVNTFGVVNAGANHEFRGWSNALAYGIGSLVVGFVVLRADRSGGQP